MPRRSNMGVGSAFDQFQRQARDLLGKLRREINAKEAELKRLKEDESRLGLLTGSTAPKVGRGRAQQRGGGVGGGRINWKTVLAQMPKQFKASDIRDVQGLKDKRPSEIFAAITRWIDAGMVKRKARGLYERAS